MIVIATNNGMEFLPRLLSSIEKYGSGEHKICVVDTGSDDEKFLEYLKTLPEDYIVTQTPYKGYETGAYIHAYKNYVSDGYIFLHDSMEVLRADWIDMFTQKDCDVCYYSHFNMAYDSQEQAQRLVDIGIYNVDTFMLKSASMFSVQLLPITLEHGKENLRLKCPDCGCELVHQEGCERCPCCGYGRCS
jgi:glycosyltransferase involved in cell wall biosynthesis